MNKKFFILISFFISIVIWVSIALSEYYYSSYKLELLVVDVPENYTVSSSTPEFVTVKIKGEGWTLLPLEFGAQKSFIISAKNDSSNFTQNLISSIQLNSWYNNKMNILEINPQEIKIKIEPKVERLVRIQPKIELGFKRGFGLASDIVIQPESVIVKGPFSEVRFLNFIETEEVVLKELDEPTEVIVALKNYKGFEPSIYNVKILLDVQRIIENTISDVPIIVENVPINVEVHTFPKTLNLTLRGGIDYFSKYDKGEFVAKIDFKDILKDTLGYLRPDIQIPKNFDLVSTKPDIVKYIIKKF